MNGMVIFSIILLISHVSSGSEIDNSFKLFELLPLEMRAEVIKHHIRYAVCDYIKRMTTIEQFTHMLYDDVKLLPRCALTNRYFLQTSQKLVPIVFQEKDIQDLIDKNKKRAIGSILSFAQSKGFKLEIQSDNCAGAYKHYLFAYTNLKGRLSRWKGKAKFASNSDLMRLPTAEKVIEFLLGSYFDDEDANTLRVIRFAFESGVYPSKSVFLQAKRSGDEKLETLLSEYQEKIL